MPVIKKNEKGVYVLAEVSAEHGHAAPKPAAADKPAPAATATPAPAAPQQPTAVKAPATPAATAPAPAAKPAEHKAGAEPNRQLFKRSTYSGVADTGPVPGETFDQKVARLVQINGETPLDAVGGPREIHLSAPVAAPRAAIRPLPAADPTE